MVLDTRRSPPLVAICDFNALQIRDPKVNGNTKSYLSSNSPQPVSHRNLRSIVTNRIPSNIVIVSKRTVSPTSSNVSKSHHSKRDYKQNQKQTGFNVYRSIIRSRSQFSVTSERDSSNVDSNSLAATFTVDRVPLLPNTGLYYPQNVSKLQKHDPSPTHKRTTSSKTEGKNQASLSSYYDCAELTLSLSQKITDHTTTRRKQSYDESSEDQTNAKIMITKTMFPCTPKDQSRKQLHVYMPQVSC